MNKVLLFVITYIVHLAAFALLEILAIRTNADLDCFHIILVSGLLVYPVILKCKRNIK